MIFCTNFDFIKYYNKVLFILTTKIFGSPINSATWVSVSLSSFTHYTPSSAALTWWCLMNQLQLII